LANGSNIVQVTEDHTQGMDRVLAGELSVEEAQQDPDWHVMSNWLGFESYRVATYRVPVVPGDRLLLWWQGGCRWLQDPDQRLGLSEVQDRPTEEMVIKRG
jgi:serine/threonine protein phosphatase PrpC